MYTINHMWVANMDGVIPEGRSKVYGLYKTMDEALVNLKDAKKAWLSAALEDGYPIPEPASTETFSGQFKLRLPKSLHRDLTERAKEEGTSLNQYCVYLLSQRIRTHSI